MLSVIEKVAPGTLHILKRRFYILSHIQKSAPIGRRTLAERLGFTERVLRKEVEVLRNQGLIKTSNQGMECTPTGITVFYQLEELMGQHVKSQEKETRLANALGIQHCTIVIGNSDKDKSSLVDMARASTEVIDFLLPEGSSTIAVMGGTTMLEVAEVMTQQIGLHRELVFVPARGGLGESVDIQANVIADIMARKTSGKSRALYAPEHVRMETYSLLLEEPEIKETLEILENTTLVLYSIGDAFEMAQRRGLDEETLSQLIDKGAVAEAFGEFIDPNGDIVYKLSRIGLQSSKLPSIPHVIAVAGGKEKAEAIRAHMKTVPPHTWLVTDEAAANEILNG
ncbi:sugar-binding transcriptional regulator [Alkalibacterium olivapovliticus]|uniref:Central glycolytic genes regulator n=1 Tax=Alkalibacterium olivapovliticus TaxID=99907 RepID=A0A2T0W7E6_9LACT|nr:sugar-binding domain-containing protein [Alkalibacterium olivapovliticus]PRY82622.1 central glycolytic genes regulator [Alkalibacterium olivapovliticus]